MNNPLVLCLLVAAPSHLALTGVYEVDPVMGQYNRIELCSHGFARFFSTDHTKKAYYRWKVSNGFFYLNGLGYYHKVEENRIVLTPAEDLSVQVTYLYKQGEIDG